MFNYLKNGIAMLKDFFAPVKNALDKAGNSLLSMVNKVREIVGLKRRDWNAAYPILFKLSQPFRFACCLGFSLVEMLLVVVFIALLLAGALAMYNSTRASNSASQMSRDIVALQAGVNALYAGQSDYSGLGNEVLFNAQKIPTTLHYSDGTLTNDDGSTLTVEGDGTEYTITITNVPKATCLSVLPALNSGWTGVSVGGNAVKENASEFPVTVDEANTACSQSTQDIVYTSGTVAEAGN